MVATTRPWTVTATAQRFVGDRRAQEHLDALVELTAVVFPDARQISADLHEDPDVADTRWVVIRVEIAWADAERARRARDEWYARTAEILPATALADFGLEIDRRPG